MDSVSPAAKLQDTIDLLHDASRAALGYAKDELGRKPDPGYAENPFTKVAAGVALAAGTYALGILLATGRAGR